MKINTLKKLKKSSFTIADAEEVGISRQLLQEYLRKGLIERISHGVYGFPDLLGFGLEDLITQALQAAPKAVVGFQTALALYDLTDQATSEIHLIVPTNNALKQELEDVEVHLVSPAYYRLGVENFRGFPVTSLERTIVDFLRSGEPISSMVEVSLRARGKGKQVDLSLLRSYGKKMRAKGKVENLIEALP